MEVRQQGSRGCGMGILGESIVTVATCNLNQWALDFDGNLARVERSIRESKAMGARYRLGPELELCGYGCEDHFLETDTFVHCDESLATLLAGDATDGILCDVGCPVLHRGVRYNCRVICLDRRILLIRPKLCMADDGNYRETRWFTTWKRHGETEDHQLSAVLSATTGQTVVPFGQAAVSTKDTMVAAEACEELWTPQAPHIAQFLAGVEIVGNGSASHHELRKLNQRLELIVAATRKSGGVYLYSNQRGCDGGRLYYDGCALIVCNGNVLAQASQFGIKDVEVISAVVNLDEVRSYRAACSSRMEQSSSAPRLAQVAAHEFMLCSRERLHPTVPRELRLHSPEEECALGPACWLWDYLRRSGAAGYFLPLSGGADSAAVTAIVGAMCRLACDGAREDEEVAASVRTVANLDASAPLPSPRDFANAVLHTSYLSTSNSGSNTRKRAAALAQEVGAYHSNISIDAAVSAVVGIFKALTGREPRFSSQGGTPQEDLALQNIQARMRMVMSYLFAQLLPWVRGRKGFLLVLGTANVDEALRGYMTKYDCSSADLNPIGAISKVDLKRMLIWAAEAYEFPTLQVIAGAPPTAELRPAVNVTVAGENVQPEHSQLDEEDMGMTYAELSLFGRLRKVRHCGPVSMLRALLPEWPTLAAQEVAAKVKRFFFYYSVNRHKQTTLTPSYHAEAYSPDDNRFDLRPFLYPTKWSRQFRCMDQLAEAAADPGGS